MLYTGSVSYYFVLIFGQMTTVVVLTKKNITVKLVPKKAKNK